MSIQDLAVLSGKLAPGEEAVKVEGIGSGFVWDTLGHVVGGLFILYSLVILETMLVTTSSWSL